ncbi:MAG TPA: transposase [Candidatus Binatia bacterium]|jgi:REP element-mobilizing transposase RayT
MARRPRLFAPGLLYHVIVRGNQRQKTFLARRDYEAYLERLARYREKYGVAVCAYCLMPNHVHLLVECGREPLSKFMQGLQQSYTQYFNRRRGQAGHLFQGRYKAIICDKDEYLLELIRYIHLNPVRARMARTPEHYVYSGHRTYIAGKATAIVDPRPALNLFGGRKAYGRFVREGMGDGHKDEYYEAEDQRFLGRKEFGEKVRAETERETERRIKKPALGRAVEALAKRLKTNPAELTTPDRSWERSRLRTMIAYLLVKHGGYKVGAVAAYFGRDQSTISSLLSRFSQRERQAPELQAEVKRLARDCLDIHA